MKITMIEKKEVDGITYHYDLTQGTDEWLKARLGIVTASEINNLITPKGAVCTSEKMRTYACTKTAERELMCIEDHFESFDMMRGNFQEVIARDAYNDNFAEVTECGFITREFGSVVIGASPDGLVGEDGVIEIKSRLSKFQIKTIVMNEVPTEYINQIQGGLLVSDRKWMDFVQYSNGMPLFVKRVLPDLERQEQIIAAVKAFEVVVEEMRKNYVLLSTKLVKTERVEMDFSDDVINVVGE